MFLTDPASREVISEEEFTDDGEFTVQVTRRMKQKSWKEERECVILRTGTNFVQFFCK